MSQRRWPTLQKEVLKILSLSLGLIAALIPATKKTSIINSPWFNEADNLRELYSRLKTALKLIKKSYQIIFVGDGSIDFSFEILRQITLADLSMQVIRFW